MDPVDSPLKIGIITAIDQIITKSGRDDFRLFVTGYPTFFNDETKYCDCESIIDGRSCYKMMSYISYCHNLLPMAAWPPRLSSRRQLGISKPRAQT